MTGPDTAGLPVDLLPVLVHIQTHLDGDLSLRVLAALAGRSPSRFHRIFTAGIGETPRAYTSRLRLERAALRLTLWRTTVAETARAVGYARPETFSRAFARRFGVTPKRLQRTGLVTVRSALGNRQSERTVGTAPLAYTLSATRVIATRPMHVAFIRHVGPYEAVDESIFERLKSWAAARGLPPHRPLLGIGHDAPGITPSSRLRFDAGVVVDGPFTGSGGVAHQVVAGGRFAVTTHVGPYATLPEVYGRLFRRLLALSGVRPGGLPAIEVYGENRVNPRLSLNHTDIYLPVIAVRESTAGGRQQ